MRSLPPSSPNFHPYPEHAGLRVTEDTELGDNDSVKQPKDAIPMNNRRARKQEKQQAAG